MATTTRTILRGNLAAADGFYFSSTTTSAGAADGTTLIDTGIPLFDTSLLVNKWVYVTGAGATNDVSGQRRRISSVAGSTVTLVTGFTLRVDTSVTYIIVPWDPVDCHNALAQAERIINRDSPLFLTPDETLVVDNLVANWDFETFAGGAFTSWSSVGAPTLTQNTNYYVHGSNAANIAGAASTGISQNLLTVAGGFANISRAQGKTLHIRGWLRATAASNARLRVTFDGSTYTNDNGGYHAGNSDWEGPNIHAIDVAIPTAATQMTVVVAKDAASDIQADVVVAWIDPIFRYTVPTSFIHPSPLWVSQQEDQLIPNGDYRRLSLEHPPIPGRIMRLEGFGRLTVPTTDAGTVELDQARGELVVALAGQYLHRALKNEDYGNEARHAQKEADWAVAAQELKTSPTIARSLPLTFNNRHNPWRVRDESGTSYLLLADRHKGRQTWGLQWPR